MAWTSSQCPNCGTAWIPGAGANPRGHPAREFDGCPSCKPAEWKEMVAQTVAEESR